MPNSKRTYSNARTQALWCALLAGTPLLSPESVRMVRMLRDWHFDSPWLVCLTVCSALLTIAVRYGWCPARRFTLKFLAVFWFSCFCAFSVEVVYSPLTVMFFMLGVSAITAWRLEL